jgi:hypothetical protein
MTIDQQAYTPGPWKVIPSPHGDKYRCVQFGADDMYTSLEMLPKDARLTAAAPDLVEALRKAVEVIRVWHNMGGPAAEGVWPIYWRSAPEMKPIRKALAKAGIKP